MLATQGGTGIVLLPWNDDIIRDESDFTHYMDNLDESRSVVVYHQLVRQRLSDRFPGLIVGWTVGSALPLVVGQDGERQAVFDAWRDIERDLWDEPDLFILERE